MSELKPRYYVDERVGCIAVRDRQNTNPNDSGLDWDTEGVIEFWVGEREYNVCPTCGQRTTSYWILDEEYRKVARKLCEELNAKERKERADQLVLGQEAGP